MSQQPSRAAADVTAARDLLRDLIPPGTTVYTALLGEPSRSGMARTIALYVMQDNEPRWITWTVATALRERWDDRREGIRVTGAGMDMGFALVYDLAHTLYPEGFPCTGDRCPSNDHSNGMREHGPGIRHTSGGYALRHRWL